MTSTAVPSLHNVELSQQAGVNTRNAMHVAGLYLKKLGHDRCVLKLISFLGGRWQRGMSTMG
jgi:hypothetical protein